MPYRFTQDRSTPGVYHVWGRVRDGLWLFRDDADREVFESIIVRHLSSVEHRDGRGRAYACLRGEVRLCAANLLWSHFHLILWQRVPGGIDRLMRRVLAAYSRYYHRRYGTSGQLLEGRYRARAITGRKSLKWRIAYVHDNHKREGLSWRFSTHRFFAEAEGAPSWIEVERTLRVFGDANDYRHYMDSFRLRRDLDSELRIDDSMGKG